MKPLIRHCKPMFLTWPMMMRNRLTQHNKQQGFTLLEVLLAIGITAVIGLGATELLRNIINANDGTEARAMQLRDLQRMDFWIKRDLLQVNGRQVRDIYGDHTKVLSAEGDLGFEFTRSGVPKIPNQDFKRSNMQRVAYGIRTHDSEYCESARKRIEQTGNREADGSCLVRWFWAVLDQAPDSEPIVQVLLDEMEEARFYFRGQIIDGQNPENNQPINSWQEEWPPSTLTKTQIADLAQVKFEYTVPVMGTIERIYEVPRYAFAE